MPHNALYIVTTGMDKPDFSKIGPSIRAHRLAADMSQVQLAKEVDKTQTTVSDYENNVVVPPYEVLILLCHIFSKRLGRHISLWDLTRLEATKDPSLDQVDPSGIDGAIIDFLRPLPDDDKRKLAILNLVNILSTSHEPKGGDNES